MFSGIIQDMGEITGVARGDDLLRLTVSHGLGKLAQGASVACSGACLTVVEASDAQFAAELSPETQDVTWFGSVKEGDFLNLEPALRVGDPLDGHIVTGHVDGLAEIISITPQGESYTLEAEAPKALAKFIAAKGSVTLDGVSLTVNMVEHSRFTVMIIPHTWKHTTFQYNQAGDRLHLEIDILARYMARMVDSLQLTVDGEQI